ADAVRRALVVRGESFVFETVFSDPVGDKIAFLEDTAHRGYAVVLCFIGLSGPDQSIQRVAMRVSQGGHDIHAEKLRSRVPRNLENLRKAILRLPFVLIFDNTDLDTPFRMAAIFNNGQLAHLSESVP